MHCFQFPSGLEDSVSVIYTFFFFTAGHIAQRRSHQVCQKANDASAEGEVKMYRYLTGERIISTLILGTI